MLSTIKTSRHVSASETWIWPRTYVTSYRGIHSLESCLEGVVRMGPLVDVLALRYQAAVVMMMDPLGQQIVLEQSHAGAFADTLQYQS